MSCCKLGFVGCKQLALYSGSVASCWLLSLKHTKFRLPFVQSRCKGLPELVVRHSLAACAHKALKFTVSTSPAAVHG